MITLEQRVSPHPEVVDTELDSGEVVLLHLVHLHRSAYAMGSPVVSLGYETTYLYSILDRGGAHAVGSRPTHRGGLPGPTGSNHPRECPSAVPEAHSAAGGLCRPDGPQRHPCL